MQWNESDVSVVRKVADEMWDSDGEVILPGWHRDHLDDRAVAIITGALGVVSGLNADKCARVQERELGALLRYIVDIMEP